MADPVYARVYRPESYVAHLRDESTGRVQCVQDYQTKYGGFLGTGSQEERDRAEAMPLCKRCGRKAGMLL